VPPTVPPRLVSWWPGAGNPKDLVGTNNGTLQSGATYAPGIVGQAFSFDGTNADVFIPGSPSLQFTNQFTIECWIHPNEVSNNRQIFTMLGKLSAYCYFATSTNGSLRLFISDDNFNAYSLQSAGGVLTAGAWAHVAAIFIGSGGGNLILCVNGAPVASRVSVVNTVFNGGPPSAAYIGGITASGFMRFSGLIDELTVYNRALSSTEIQSIYNAGSAGKCLAPLYITAINPSATNVNLSWLALKGVSYRAQYKTNLNDASWKDVSGDVTATNNTATKTDVPPDGDTPRFYRVKLLQ
jgi:hypothetical protein